LHYRPGEFLNALKPESAERNESMWIGCETLDEPVRRFAVRQISGLIARRIVCPLVPGSIVSRGEKFGMIKLGSRTELILPVEGVEVTVCVGDKVRAGSDVVARWT
jgi:phosphatidylserine decarboxylase